VSKRILGTRLVCGIPDRIMPIADRPKGKMRLDLRDDFVARAFFKDGKVTRQFIISHPRKDGQWVLIEETAAL